MVLLTKLFCLTENSDRKFPKLSVIVIDKKGGGGGGGGGIK